MGEVISVASSPTTALHPPYQLARGTALYSRLSQLSPARMFP
jgi:hypothetical protein